MPQKTGERAGSSASSCVQPGVWSLGATGLHAVLGGTIGVELPGPQSGQGRGRGRTDEGAVGALSPLRLPPRPDFSCPRRLPYEPRPGLPAVADGEAAGAAQTAEEAGCGCPAATASTLRAEPGIDNWSLSLDLKILLLTALSPASYRNAY